MKTPSALLLLAAGLACSVTVGAAEPPQAPAGSAYYQGSKVAIDPATGRVRPMTAAEIRQLRAAFTQSRLTLARKGPATAAQARQTIRVTANGTVVAQVPEDLMSNLVATRRADGSLQVGHVGDAEAVSQTQEPAHE